MFRSYKTLFYFEEKTMSISLPLVSTIAGFLTTRQQKLATAESCTGGGLAYVLTEIPGSSNWFEQGWVTYSNTAKMRELGVDAVPLHAFGAVSSEVAAAMVEGILQQAPVDFAISVTGIAGPDGGTDTKPLGLVWFGFGQREQAVETVSHIFTGDRAAIREQAIIFALEGWLERYSV
jgi:nicotinamide-nucleotide amidase